MQPSLLTAELEATDDLYDGKIVATSSLPADPQVFAARLRRSLESWSAAGTRGVWLKLGLSLSPLIPEAVDQGFEFHHAERVSGHGGGRTMSAEETGRGFWG
jgi:hypothetical protein